MKPSVADELGKALVRRGAWQWAAGQVVRLGGTGGAGGQECRPSTYILVDVPPEMISAVTMRELGVMAVGTARLAGPLGSSVTVWPDMTHPSNAGWLASAVDPDWLASVQCDAREVLTVFREPGDGRKD